MCSMPSRCPKCGSDNVDKELYLGSRTGDWICGDCSASGWIGGNYDNSNKSVSVQIFVDSKEAGVITAEVASAPDENGCYGILTKKKLGQYESENPVPIELKDGKYVAMIPSKKL